MKETMTIEHPLWDDFLERLEKKPCNGTHKESIAILKTMKNIDIEGSLEYFESRGGYCDCELCMNVSW